MFSLSALCTVLIDVVRALTARTILLYTDQFRDMQPGSFRISCSLRCFKIVKYIQYSIVWQQHVVQWLHTSEMSALFNGFTCFAWVFATFMFSEGNDEFVTWLAEAFTFTNTLLVPPFQLIFGETWLTSKVSITVRARDSNPCLYTWRTRHSITTCLITCVWCLFHIPLHMLYMQISLSWCLSGSLSRYNAVSHHLTADSDARKFRPALQTWWCRNLNLYKNNLILFEMVLNLFEFWDTRTIS
jgi:hypothetical protein